MWVDIKNAPFTEAEKLAIIALGIEQADWGHPDVVLDDPVAFFTKRIENSMALVKEGGAGLTHYALREKIPPFSAVPANKKDQD